MSKYGNWSLRHLKQAAQDTSPDGVAAAADHFAQGADLMAQAQDSFMDTITSLRAAWQGEAAQSAMDNAEQSSQQMDEQRSVATFARSISTEYADNVQQNRARMADIQDVDTSWGSAAKSGWWAGGLGVGYEKYQQQQQYDQNRDQAAEIAGVMDDNGASQQRQLRSIPWPTGPAYAFKGEQNLPAPGAAGSGEVRADRFSGVHGGGGSRRGGSAADYASLAGIHHAGATDPASLRPTGGTRGVTPVTSGPSGVSGTVPPPTVSSPPTASPPPVPSPVPPIPGDPTIPGSHDGTGPQGVTGTGPGGEVGAPRPGDPAPGGSPVPGSTDGYGGLSPVGGTPGGPGESGTPGEEEDGWHGRTGGGFGADEEGPRGRFGTGYGGGEPGRTGAGLGVGDEAPRSRTATGLDDEAPRARTTAGFGDEEGGPRGRSAAALEEERWGRAGGFGGEPVSGEAGRGGYPGGRGAGRRRDEEEEAPLPDYLVETDDVWGSGVSAAPPVIGE